MSWDRSVAYQFLGVSQAEFVRALTQAEHVPGAIDSLVDSIRALLTPNEIAQVIRELASMPAAFSLIGRIEGLYPSDFRIQREIERFHRIAILRGEKMVDMWSPKHWYPPLEDIQQVLVTRHRMQGSSILIRMAWGEEYDGVQALWMVRYDGTGLPSLNFVVDQDLLSQEPLDWTHVSLDEALGLMETARLMQSIRSPYSIEDANCAAVNFWRALTQDKTPTELVDWAYRLEGQEMTPEKVAFVFVHAKTQGDLVLVYDLLTESERPKSLKEYLKNQWTQFEGYDVVKTELTASQTLADGRRRVIITVWDNNGQGLEQYQFRLGLMQDDRGQWRVHSVKESIHRPAEVTENTRALTSLSVPVGFFPLLRAEEFHLDLPGAVPAYESPLVVTFVAGQDMDYQMPLDLSLQWRYRWSVVENSYVILMALTDELYQIEMERLKGMGRIGAPLHEDTVRFLDIEELLAMAEDGIDAALKHLQMLKTMDEGYGLWDMMPDFVEQTQGQCMVCRGVYSKNGMGRHLDSCASERLGRGQYELWQMGIENVQNPGDWTKIVVRPNLSLVEFDQALRNIFSLEPGLDAFIWYRDKIYSLSEVPATLDLFQEVQPHQLIGEMLVLGSEFSYGRQGMGVELTVKIVKRAKQFDIGESSFRVLAEST